MKNEVCHRMILVDPNTAIDLKTKQENNAITTNCILNGSVGA